MCHHVTRAHERAQDGVESIRHVIIFDDRNLCQMELMLQGAISLRVMPEIEKLPEATWVQTASVYVRL